MVPVLVVNVCMVWSLSVHRAVVCGVYQTLASFCSGGHNVLVAARMALRGIVVNASERSKWMMVCCGFEW